MLYMAELAFALRYLTLVININTKLHDQSVINMLLWISLVSVVKTVEQKANKTIGEKLYHNNEHHKFCSNTLYPEARSKFIYKNKKVQDLFLTVILKHRSVIYYKICNGSLLF